MKKRVIICLFFCFAIFYCCQSQQLSKGYYLSMNKTGRKNYYEVLHNEFSNIQELNNNGLEAGFLLEYRHTRPKNLSTSVGIGFSRYNLLAKFDHPKFTPDSYLRFQDTYISIPVTMSWTIAKHIRIGLEYRLNTKIIDNTSIQFNYYNASGKQTLSYENRGNILTRLYNNTVPHQIYYDETNKPLQYLAEIGYVIGINNFQLMPCFVYQLNRYSSSILLTSRSLFQEAFVMSHNHYMAFKLVITKRNEI